VQQITLGSSSLTVSRLAYGCWRLAGSEGAPPEPNSDTGKRAVLAAVDAGYTLFDLADIYGGGRCESIFGEALRETPGLRDRLVIATKCGIRPGGSPAGMPGRYDFSAAHILQSVEGSLKRLGVETLDLLMLHRPDYLMDPVEVAGAFDRLHSAGKVREFGVSNFRSAQVSLLQQFLPRRLCVHQVEISLLQRAALDDGALDQCLTEQLTPMAWSPLAGGLLGERVHGLLPGQRGYQPDKIRPVLDSLAAGLGVTRAQLALAWLMKNPARIQPVIGSVQPGSIRDLARATEISLSREDWYRLLVAAHGAALP
jgi:predicted oxidoreductase